MKNFLFLSVFALVLMAVSGCSLAPDDSQKNQGEKTYALSGSFWKSTDGGKTWQVKNKISKKPRIADPDVLSLAINPQNPGQIFAGLRNGGIIKTENGGETWEFSEIFTSEKVYGLALDPVEPRIIYASAVYQGRGKIFKSEDAGKTWKEIYTSAADGPLVISLAIGGRSRNVIYAATSDNALIKSVDFGGTWRNIFQANSPVLKIAIDSADSNLVYFISQRGELWRSRDAGEKFEKLAINILSSKENTDIKKRGKVSFHGGDFDYALTDPNKSNCLYLAGAGGMIRSRDAGDSWETIPALNNPGSYPVRALAISPFNSDEILYGVAQASYKSSDSGRNWSTFQFESKKGIRILEFDPRNPGVVYAAFSE